MNIIVKIHSPSKNKAAVKRTAVVNSNKPSNIEHRCTVQYNTLSAIFENE
jgi:hypothetical protein